MQLRSSPTSSANSSQILIAEDHLDSRDAMCELLKTFGYRVLVAVDGREAIDLARTEKPDLILMDIMMPELDGFGATRILREHRETEAIPIIAVTAMEGARELALQAGADDFVRKPVDIHGLIAKVRTFLDSEDPRRDAALNS